MRPARSLRSTGRQSATSMPRAMPGTEVTCASALSAVAASIAVSPGSVTATTRTPWTWRSQRMGSPTSSRRRRRLMATSRGSSPQLSPRFRPLRPCASPQ
jgi:hypothetical protein